MKKILFNILVLIITFNYCLCGYCFTEDSFKLDNTKLSDLKVPLEEITGGQLYGIIQLYINEGNYNKAIELSNIMIKDYPYIAQGYILLAKAKRKLGDTDDLEEIYTKCIEECPNDSRAYIYRGIIRYNQNRFKEAIEDFNIAIKFDDGTWHKSYKYINRAVSKYFYGDKTSALKDYNKAIELDEKLKSNAQFYYNRGICKFDLGDIEGAKEDYRNAVIIAPEANFIYYGN